MIPIEHASDEGQAVDGDQRPGGVGTPGRAAGFEARPAGGDGAPNRYRSGTFLRQAAGALVLSIVIKIVQLLFIVWLAPPGNHTGIRDRLLAWDGGWFLHVAIKGYEHGFSYDPTSGAMVGNGLAFFPLYPLLVRLGYWLGLSPAGSALTVPTLASLAAAVLLLALGIELKDARVGYALVVLFSAQPMAVVLSMGYSEALFAALVIGAFLAAYRQAFLWAGVLGLGAALTRPTGLAAAIAIAVAGALALRPGQLPPGRRWRAVVGPLVALAGVPGYLLWVGLRVGTLTAWFSIQTAGWGTTFDYGDSTWHFIRDAFRTGTGWIQVSVAFMLVAAIIATVFAIVRQVWPPLIVYGVLALGLVVGQAGYYHSKPRLMVPVLLTLIPAAYAAARARPAKAALWLTAYALIGLWWGAYMITIWPYAI